MREIIIEGEKYISVITDRISSCDGCDLKGFKPSVETRTETK